MKKLNLIFLLTIPFLASCGNNNEASKWSSEYNEIMETHLNGNYLPYIEGEGLTLTYNRAEDAVVVDIPNVDETTFANYKTSLLNDGYSEVVVECLKENYTAHGFHTYSKSVNKGVLYVDIYCLNSDNEYKTKGDMNIDAYFYEIVAGEQEPIVWTVVEKRIMKTYLKGNVLPLCDVANAVVTFDEEGHCVRISAPYASEESVQTYIQTLTTNGYTKVTTGNENIGFYQCELEIDTTTTLVVQTYTYHNQTNLGTSGEFFVDAFIEIDE